LSRFDPWLSYALMIGLAILALYFIEKPAQRKLREWMHATTVVKSEGTANKGVGSSASD
jgi:peptidoglycan/LPS O-acetylase OafA/YrhL